MKRDTSYEGLTGKWQQYQILRAGDIPRGQSSKPLVPNLFGIVCLYSQEMCNCNALSHIVYLWAMSASIKKVCSLYSFQSFLESQGGKTLRIGPIGPHLDPDWNTWTIIKWIALKLVQIFMDLREWILITSVSPLLIVKYLYLLHGLVQNSIQSFTVVRTYMTLVSLIFCGFEWTIGLTKEIGQWMVWSHVTICSTHFCRCPTGWSVGGSTWSVVFDLLEFYSASYRQYAVCNVFHDDPNEHHELKRVRLKQNLYITTRVAAVFDLLCLLRALWKSVKLCQTPFIKFGQTFMSLS